MKKSFVCLAALAMAFGLASCGETTSTDSPDKPDSTPESPTSTPDSPDVSSPEDSTPVGPSVELPHEEGKLTFYFELGDEDATPEYVSYFATGNWLKSVADTGKDWPTSAANGAIEFVKLEDTNIYYGFSAFVDSEQTNLEYQLTAGYASDSGAPSTGVNWSYKSDECLAVAGDAGLGNPSFTLDSEKGEVALGTHHFTTSGLPGAIQMVENVTVSITLKEAAPEGVTLYAPGNYRNNWSCKREDDAMTPSADRKTWTILIQEQIISSYEMKIVADFTKEPDEGGFGWDHVILDNGAGGNYALGLLRKYSNATIDLCDEDHLDLPDGIEHDWTWAMPQESEICDITFRLVSPIALSGDWMVKGNFDGWDKLYAMTATDETKTVFETQAIELEIGLETGFDLAYGIVADPDWHTAIKNATEDANIAAHVTTSSVVIVTIDEDVAAAINERLADSEGAADWVSFNYASVTVEAVTDELIEG